MWTQIADRKYYFGTISLFLIFAISLLFLFPEGRSFFVLNGMYADVLDNIMPYITHIGDGLFAVIISFLFLLFYRINYGLIALAGVGVSGLITFVCKTYIFTVAPRPKLFFWGNKMIHYIDSNYYVNIEHSFPSGHSLTAFFLFTFLVFSIFGKGYAMQILLAFCAIVAAYSRVYLAHHFVGDITAGAIIGTVLAVLLHLLYQKLKRIKFLNKNIIQIFSKGDR